MSSRKKNVDLSEYFIAIERANKLRSSDGPDSKEYLASVEKATRLFLQAHGETKVGVDTGSVKTWSRFDPLAKLSINEIYDVLNGDIDDL